MQNLFSFSLIIIEISQFYVFFFKFSIFFILEARVRDEVELMDASASYKPMPDSMIGPFKGKKKCKDNGTDT